ncbi:MAG: hypothetical protein MZU97_07755 [Bacillus subtilis]|nr:hypothetical protein [Bacillus subtilis]
MRPWHPRRRTWGSSLRPWRPSSAIPGHRFLIEYSFGLRGLYENLLSQIHGQFMLHAHYVLPGHLNFDPDLPTLTRWSWGLALEAGILGCALAAGLWNLKRRPLVSFAILWVFLHSMAVYAAVPRTDILNERHLYLGGFGLFLLAAAGAAWFADHVARAAPARGGRRLRPADRPRPFHGRAQCRLSKRDPPVGGHGRQIARQGTGLQQPGLCLFPRRAQR